MARQAIGKRVRFDIFKRDRFTCRYCGAQPPDVILVIDHVRPVVEGGDNEDINLITACEACNQGKGKRPLSQLPPNEDLDLRILEAQQEIAELRQFQEWKAKRDQLRDEVVLLVQHAWCDCSNLDWHPSDHVCIQLLTEFSANIVLAAVESVAPKVASGYVKERKFVAYLFQTCRGMEERGLG